VTPVEYTVTTPAGETKTFLTALEAKREIRRHGGGTLRVVEQAKPEQAESA
jgi:hypothetical protein